MNEFVENVGFTVFQCIAQILVGTTVGALLFHPFQRAIRFRTFGVPAQVTIITVTSLIGIIAPLSTYGIIPIFIMLIAAGLKSNITIPIMLSNYLYNMLVPFTTPDFTWRTGWLRIFSAFLIGVIGGHILTVLAKTKTEIQTKHDLNFYGNITGIRSVAGSIGRAVSALGVYVICGSIAEEIFQRYVLFNATSQFFSQKGIASITNAFMKFNVVNPLFLLAVEFLYVIANLVGISALLSIFKIKSAIMFIFYITVCALLLSLSMLIR
jgi:hypothetical protein